MNENKRAGEISPVYPRFVKCTERMPPAGQKIYYCKYGFHYQSDNPPYRGTIFFDRGFHPSDNLYYIFEWLEEAPPTPAHEVKEEGMDKFRELCNEADQCISNIKEAMPGAKREMKALREKEPATEPVKDTTVEQKLPSCRCTSGEDCNGDCIIPKWVAIKLLAIRDALVKNDYEEAWHQLYSIASPDFDKYSNEVWRGLEDFAGVPFPTPKPITDEQAYMLLHHVEENSGPHSMPKPAKEPFAAEQPAHAADPNGNIREDIMDWIHQHPDANYVTMHGVYTGFGPDYWGGVMRMYRQQLPVIAKLTEQRDHAEESKQKLIDDLEAKSDEALEYRCGLEKVRQDPNKHPAVGKLIDTVLEKYPLA